MLEIYSIKTKYVLKLRNKNNLKPKDAILTYKSSTKSELIKYKIHFKIKLRPFYIFQGFVK